MPGAAPQNFHGWSKTRPRSEAPGPALEVASKHDNKFATHWTYIYTLHNNSIENRYT